MICKICARETDSAALSHSSELPSASSVSSMSKSPSFPATSKSEKLRTTWLRTFWRRNQSIVAFETMRWKSSGSSAGGRSTYFSERRIIASWTMSSAASSSRTAYTARFQARFSTLFRKSESSLSVAKERKQQGPQIEAWRLSHRPLLRFAKQRICAVGCDNSLLHDSFDRQRRPNPRQRRAVDPGTTPASRGRGKVHRWFFVREIHRGFRKSWKHQRPTC